MLLGKGYSNVYKLLYLPKYETAPVYNLQFSGKYISRRYLNLCPIIWQLPIFQMMNYEQILVLYLHKYGDHHWCCNCHKIARNPANIQTWCGVNVFNIACPTSFRTVNCPSFPRAKTLHFVYLLQCIEVASSNNMVFFKKNYRHYVIMFHWLTANFIDVLFYFKFHLYR